MTTTFATHDRQYHLDGRRPDFALTLVGVVAGLTLLAGATVAMGGGHDPTKLVPAAPAEVEQTETGEDSVPATTPDTHGADVKPDTQVAPKPSSPDTPSTSEPSPPPTVPPVPLPGPETQLGAILPEPGPDPDVDDDALNPCRVAADEGRRISAPDTIELPPGAMAGSFNVLACDPNPVAVVVTAPAGVTPAFINGSIDPSSTDLAFVIDETMFDEDEIEFSINLAEIDCCDIDVTVRATKPMPIVQMESAGVQAQAPLGPVFEGTGAAGCAADCISSFSVTPHLTSVGVDLDATFSNAATVQIFLSNEPPVDWVPGWPIFTDSLMPLLTSGDEAVTAVHTDLGQLQTDVEYFIILQATDEHGNSFRTTSFELDQPIDDIGGLAPAAQALQLLQR